MSVISKIQLSVSVAKFALIQEALAWYEESLHMLTDPQNIEPVLPLEQLTRPEKKRRVVEVHILRRTLERELA